METSDVVLRKRKGPVEDSSATANSGDRCRQLLEQAARADAVCRATQKIKLTLPRPDKVHTSPLPCKSSAQAFPSLRGSTVAVSQPPVVRTLYNKLHQQSSSLPPSLSVPQCTANRSDINAKSRRTTFDGKSLPLAVKALTHCDCEFGSGDVPKLYAKQKMKFDTAKLQGAINEIDSIMSVNKLQEKRTPQQIMTKLSASKEKKKLSVSFELSNSESQSAGDTSVTTGDQRNLSAFLPKAKTGSDSVTTNTEQTIRICAEPTRIYYLLLLLFSVAALYMRLFSIEIPDHVCWDETHFGKMASWYINHTFFFDVHPPLGKMLIALAGYITGYDGSFPFSKPGDEYGDTQYVGMRIFCAVLGSWLVPLAYQIVWLLTRSLLASTFAALFILFDMGTTTLTRYILLDPPLLFFIVAAVYCNLKFLDLKNRPFTFCWWFWMLLTGICLSGAIGVKFVGLFVILLVGVWTAVDLNRLLADVRLPVSHVMKHLVSRAVCLILVPAVCYVGYFYIHFLVLNQSGSGDGFFSSAFQSQLRGNKLYNISMPQHVAFGSILTLKQRRTGGAYLHSHPHLYPEEHGPRQQQVTTYSHKDENNLWKIKPADRDISVDELPPILVKSGDLVRLEHVMTRRNLHSHKEPAPLSKRHYQLSGYGVNGSGDANDVWMLEIVGAPQGTPLQTVRSQIRLVHYYVRCALFSHDKKLPKWGWEQLEATCTTNTRDQRSRWSVEEVRDHRLPNISFEVYSPSFLEKFTESHAVMSQGNSGLKPKEGEVTSKPWQWPINYRGQIFSGKDHRVYLLGNPVLFWAALVLKALFILSYTLHAVKRKRRMRINPALAEYRERMFSVAWWLLLGWALHYLPFWTMSRVLYFHHYFPAFLFSAMFCGVMLDFLVTHVCVLVPEGLSLTVFIWCLGGILGTIFYSFYMFYPLTYGMHGNPPSAEGGHMHGLRWLDSWDF